MNFGKVAHPEKVDYTLPKDAPETSRLLKAQKNHKDLESYVGCAKWNRTELKGFYPRGTKDELTYYSKCFNAIELNATFYNIPTHQHIVAWKNKTPAAFKFFPKVNKNISHYKRLKDVDDLVEHFCGVIRGFGNKLGMAFLQLDERFKPKDFDRLKLMLEHFPKDVPLGIEVRSAEWFENKEVNHAYTALLEKHKMANIIVDTAGRRDLLHMRLTSPVAFIRYVGANDSTDTDRLDDWIPRIKKWRKEGLQKLYFFIHQNEELESPRLASHFIQRLNKALDLSLPFPENQNI